ncbi:hypothetical protein [Enterococcus sp. AZ109]|uniref:hypothetical protein n=1 Tax=Enterococcus sp. AZ109 TaxID=2774634 RepID=UPI003F249355
MSYAVKVMCYLDDSGNGRPSLKHAKKYDDQVMAELVAATCGGRVVEVISQEDTKKIRTKMQPKPAQPKANQAWMRQKG